MRIVPPRNALFLHEAGLEFVLMVRAPGTMSWRPVLASEAEDPTVKCALQARREMLTGRYVSVTYGQVATDFKVCRTPGYVSG